ncbi:polysaccharide lyase family 8 super-sandwich domain-containing protein [Pedobacter sp. Du54]|uniref:polysaccharide lyase family 8 super-sandwich domain-containing protein n=1 Tax=Pedobacter anseongensis TaxID=3133439 RepID=UPI0030A5A461
MNKLVLLLIFFLNLVKSDATAQNTIDSILNRHYRYILATNPLQPISSTLSTFDSTTGKWKDLNYSDANVNDWQPISHLNRVNTLAIAWANPLSPTYHKANLLNVINTALGNWYVNKYQSKNWWYNEIGVPQTILTAMVLLKNQWSEEQFKNALAILGQYRINGTGANLTWSAGIGLYYGLFTHNEDLITKTASLLQNEIKISTSEGIQPDYSFHQHGKRLQIAHYGEPFFIDNTRLAWELDHSKWAYPKQKTALIVNALLNGIQWSARGVNNPPSTIDRSVSRESYLKRTNYTVLIPFLLALSPERKLEIIAFKNSLDGKYTLRGFHYFPYSDFATYHQAGFSFFLKTLSKRTLPAEAINNENLKGKLLSSGDTYLISNGNEYFNLMPVWQWDHLPGVTAFEGAEKIGQKTFNGAVTNGSYGFSAMDYEMLGKESTHALTAKKMWASYGNVVVCLIADLKSTVKSPYTTLDQSRMQGKVTVNKKWIHHGAFAYIPLQTDSISVFKGKASGTWLSINKSQSSKLITDQVFMPVLTHRTSIPNTGYVLANVLTPKATIELVNRPIWEIVKNMGDCQAVAFSDRTLMMAFYQPTKLTYKNKEIKTNKACLLLLANGKLYASDPEHKGGLLSIIINTKTYTIDLPKDGTTSKPTPL